MRNDDQKEKIVQATLDSLLRDDPDSRAFWLREAPVVIVFCADIKRVRARFGKERAPSIANIDAGGFLLAFRVAAAIEGWTTAVMREFDLQALRKALNIPGFVDPLALLVIGRKEDLEEEEFYKPTMAVADFFHHEEW